MVDEQIAQGATLEQYGVWSAPQAADVIVDGIANNEAEVRTHTHTHTCVCFVSDSSPFETGPEIFFFP